MSESWIDAFRKQYDAQHGPYDFRHIYEVDEELFAYADALIAESKRRERIMKLYKVETPVPCDIEGCEHKDALLIVRTDEGTDHAVCPVCVESMRAMNSDNAEFFAQTPLPGMVD